MADLGAAQVVAAWSVGDAERFACQTDLMLRNVEQFGHLPVAHFFAFVFLFEKISVDIHLVLHATKNAYLT